MAQEILPQQGPQQGPPPEMAQGGMPQGGMDQQALPQEQGTAQEGMPMEQDFFGLPDSEEYELSDEQQAQLDAYVDNARLLIHTSPGNDQILKELSNMKPPQAAVAKTANLVHDMLIQGYDKNAMQYNNVTLMYGSSVLVAELIELGEVAGIFDMTPEQEGAAYQLAVQHWMARGIKGGWIDPKGMQMETEKLMPEDMRRAGEEVYNQSLVPQGRSQQQPIGGQPNPMM